METSPNEPKRRRLNFFDVARNAVASSLIEGIPVDPEVEALLLENASGAISDDELIGRLLASTARGAAR
jgi:hypothetical protein